MKLAIYDTFERKVTLTETLIWLAIFSVSIPLILESLGRLAVTVYMYFFPLPLLSSIRFYD
jgi:hypothetical protein